MVDRDSVREYGDFEGVERKCRIDVKLYKRRTCFSLCIWFVKKKTNKDRISIHESLECKCLITYNADVVCPAQRDCWLRCRELLRQAGIMDLAASSVCLEIEIYEDCVSISGCECYITNNPNDNFHMGEVKC